MPPAINSRTANNSGRLDSVLRKGVRARLNAAADVGRRMAKSWRNIARRYLRRGKFYSGPEFIQLPAYPGGLARPGESYFYPRQCGSYLNVCRLPYYRRSPRRAPRKFVRREYRLLIPRTPSKRFLPGNNSLARLTAGVVRRTMAGPVAPFVAATIFTARCPRDITPPWHIFWPERGEIGDGSLT